MEDPLKTYARKEFIRDSKRQQLEMPLQASPEFTEDVHYVFDMLKEEFQHSQKEWAKPPPTIKYKLKLPSLVTPLRKLSQTAVIIFFPGKLPSANDVVQWVQALLGGCFVKGFILPPEDFMRCIF